MANTLWMSEFERFKFNDWLIWVDKLNKGYKHFNTKCVCFRFSPFLWWCVAMKRKVRTLAIINVFFLTNSTNNPSLNSYELWNMRNFHLWLIFLWLCSCTDVGSIQFLICLTVRKSVIIIDLRLWLPLPFLLRFTCNKHLFLVIIIEKTQWLHFKVIDICTIQGIFDLMIRANRFS